MNDALVACGVCRQREPVATAEDHHRKPRAFGGTDDAANRIWLCASCHQRLHRVQDRLVRGTPVAAFDLAQTIFPRDAQARGALWELAHEAAAAERETKEGFLEARSTVRVSFEVDVDVWRVIKATAKERRTSAAQLAAAILREGAHRL